MDWYYYIALAAIISQLVFLIQMCRNYYFAMSHYRKIRKKYVPKTILIIPCKGTEPTFEKNISSFFNQNYEDFHLWFVVADKEDPAYGKLCELKEKLSDVTKANEVRILVAGKGRQCSQKIHNLLYGCRQVHEDAVVLAFADSDICVKESWLGQLIYPLRSSRNGVASGYRWFIPKTNNIATLALSALNAKIAQLLGNTHFNQAWGGSMAIRMETFRKLDIDNIWEKALSDDLSLSVAVKKAKMKVAFVPGSLVASYETMDWSGLLEFGRRQFLITRVSALGTWIFGLFSSIYSVTGLWGGAAMAIYASRINANHLGLYIFVPVLFGVSLFGRALLRQLMIYKILTDYRAELRTAMIADVLFAWLWSWLLMGIIISSAFGRTISWRGIRYKLMGPADIIILDKDSQKAGEQKREDASST